MENRITMDMKEKDLKSILIENHTVGLVNKPIPPKELRPSEWVEIRLFISSTFIDTHAERDVLIKRIIPALNRELKESCITIVPIDLRWGVLREDSKNCHAIQKTCLDEIDHCRPNKKTYPYFIGLRTQRYGWVQNDLMSSDRYNHPELFGWVEALKKHNKDLAITSLECVHAVWAREEMPPSSTMFFYEREILNPENIEEECKWIFDFEYQIDDMGCQYTETEKAGIYAEDKEKLDKYLMSLSHVKYSKYKCSYEKGGARITRNNRKKKFGIGYVKDMEDFENKVKEDLLSSIKSNFKAADLAQIPPIERNNLTYEEAMKEKATTFVDREALTNRIHSYCTSQTVGNSVMIIEGKPGQGKSALVAFVADKCIKEMRSDNHFVFAHGVDTCPQSNDLEQMLLRLHDNLCRHVGTENTLKTSEDLKSTHVSQLEEIVRNNPEQKFIVFVDAVNQLHESMQAHWMWWLPSETTPQNLRFVISTLPDDNNTFANAQRQSPNAEVVNVEEMTEEEGKNMVTTILARYNKKLTTDSSEKLLKNQMELLLNKNCTPLYLSAACEALRTLGVYEELTKEIEKFPATVQELFSYLIDRWSKEYGQEFICYLLSVITLSRDGLLENMISDILRHIKRKKHVKFEYSLSHVFSSVRGFLSSGGGGNLKFFHDQLNQVVREKYLKSSQEFVCEIHEILAGFHLEQITSQLCEKPLHIPSLYHRDCLRLVVHHQTLAMKNGEQCEQFDLTLRNIFFVREKIKENQLNELLKEYSFSLQYATDETVKSSLQKWKKFVTIYAPFIKKLPQCSHNMAINQVPSSHVYTDTKKLNVGIEYCELFPAYWVNKPCSELDHVLLKYRSEECFECATTSVEDNMVAMSIAGYDEELCMAYGYVWVYDMKTCELLAQCHMQRGITSLCFSKDKQLWVGDFKGFIHICEITTGKVVWSSEMIGEEEDRVEWDAGRRVEWSQYVNDNIICATKEGTVAHICTTTRTITNTWKTGQDDNHVYVYHHKSDVLYTGHDDSIKCWKLDGELMRSLDVEGRVYGLDVHPTKENVAVYGMWGRKLVQLNLLSGEVMWQVKGTIGKCYEVLFTHLGERVVCVDKDLQTLVMLDDKGSITNTVKGHSSSINNIKLVPGTNQVLTAGRDGSYLFNLPTTPDKQHEVGDKQYEVLSCAVLKNTNDIIVLKRDKDKKCIVERCHGDSLETLASVEVEGKIKDEQSSSKIVLQHYSTVVAHPTNNNLVVVRTTKALLFLNTESLETVARHTVVSEDKRDETRDFAICKDGTKCVVAKLFSHSSVVYDITNLNAITKLTKIKIGKGWMYSSDINADGSKVVCAANGSVVLYDVITSKPIKTLSEGRAKYVRFVDQPDGVLFVDSHCKLHLINLDGEITHSFPGTHYEYSPTLLNTPYLVTGNRDDNSIQVIDITTQKVVYQFYDPSSKGFKSFAYQPELKKMFAANLNENLYVLK